MFCTKDKDKLAIVKASPDGRSFCTFYERNLKMIATMRYRLPDQYSTKRLNDSRKITCKSYGLLEKPKIINCICNGNYMLFTTSQNMILIWKKIIPKETQINCEYNS